MSVTRTSVEVREARTGRDLNAFIKFPFALYANDPFYVPQLDRDMKTHYSSGNPFLRQAEVKFFVASKNGVDAGRVVSIVNPEHNFIHEQRAGFFGFFESTNDPEVTDALLKTVAA